MGLVDFKYFLLPIRERSTYERIVSELDALDDQLSKEIKINSVSSETIDQFNSAMRAKKNLCNEIANHYNISQENFITINEGFFFYREMEPDDILVEIAANNDEVLQEANCGKDSSKVRR